MSDRYCRSRRGFGILVVAVTFASSPLAWSTDWNAVSRGLGQMQQQLQTYEAQQKRQEMEQEKLRIAQEQHELLRKRQQAEQARQQAANRERQEAERKRKEAEERALAAEQARQAAADELRRIAEWTAPEQYFKLLAIHRDMLDSDSNETIAEFIASSAKDTFETSEAWNKRVASLRLPHRITLDLEQYDADQARFEGRLHGVPMNLPLPPDVARQLAGAKTVDLEGELKVLDANFFELANAKVLLPDGKTHAIIAKPCPKMVADLLPGPGLRAYQHPRLAALRKQILATSVAETLEKARQLGLDRQAAIAATLELRNKYAEEGQQIAATKDSAIAADLSNATGLPLNYSCQGPKKEPVCRYIEQMWRAMAAEALMYAMECR